MLGQQQRAIQDYDAARGISLFNLRRDAEAESDFKKAFELDPAFAGVSPSELWINTQGNPTCLKNGTDDPVKPRVDLLAGRFGSCDATGT